MQITVIEKNDFLLWRESFMKVKIWGSRGSIPATINAETIYRKIYTALDLSRNLIFNTDDEIKSFIETHLPFAVKGTYGTNTSCVQIVGTEEYIILDAGSGLRDLGNSIIQSGNTNCIIHIFLSHLHWDHIQGFPFFIPAFIKGNTINIYSLHDSPEQAFITQQSPPNFPVPLDYMQADINFITLQEDCEYNKAGFKVKALKQSHPGDSYCYSFEKDDRKIVYSTDSEYKEIPEGDSDFFKLFFKDADLLIFDTQYTLMDSINTKASWGHSSNIDGVEFAVKSGVKHLLMFHSEPTQSDVILDMNLEDTRKYAAIYESNYQLKVSQAYDGMVIEI